MTEFLPEGVPETLGRTRPARGATTLDHRLWFLTATDPDAELASLDPASHGLILRGRNSITKLRKVRQYRPGLPVMVEPDSCSKHVATATQPFWLPGGVDSDDGLFADDPVKMYVEAQRDGGASLAVLPTGQIKAQDSAALKSLVATANSIDGPDVLVPLAVSPKWLSDTTSRRQLIAGARRIRHAVALGLVDGSGDPMGAKGVADGYRQFFEQVPGAIRWRTDLSGFGAVACGAPGLVIGLLPSLRRFTEAGTTGRAGDDRTPPLLLRDLARFSRSGKMHTDWFAGTEPIQCDLECCNGRALDSFSERPTDIAAAAVHNVEVLGRLAKECFAQPADTRADWFARYLEDAEAAHIELGNRIGASIKLPPMIGRWRTALKPVN